jgi:hypothetical protein
MNEEEELARIAHRDQTQAAFLELARMVASYHHALVAQGMDSAYALSLAMAYQDSVLAGARRQD